MSGRRLRGVHPFPRPPAPPAGVLVPLFAAAGAVVAAVGSLLGDLLGLAGVLGLVAAGTFVLAWAQVRVAIPPPRAVTAAPPAAEGPVWRVPRRVAAFTGRDRELAALAASLAAGRHPDVVALTGIGGVGKPVPGKLTQTHI